MTMRKQPKVSTIFWSMVGALLVVSAPALAVSQQATGDVVPVIEGDQAGDGKVLADSPSSTEAEATTDEESASAPSKGTAGPILQDPEGPGQIWGSIRSEGQIAVGIRAVSQNGSESRYAKDIDLDSGVRILDTHWVLSPANRSPDAAFDRIVIDVNGAYGDPYEYYAAQVYKAGKYRFDARTRKADYKWAVVGDHNVWDTTNWFTDVSASINATQNLELYATFNHVSRNGDSLRTIDISRNEFEVDVPVDTRGQTWAVGGRYRRGGTSFYVQQEQYSFKNNVPRSTQDNPGLEPEQAEIFFFSEQQVQAIDAPATKGGFTSILADNRVQLTGDVMYSKQRLAFAFDSYWQGLDFQRKDLEAIDGALGSGDREVLHGNFFAGFAISRAASFTARYRYRSWDQNAFSMFDSAQQFLDGSSTLTVDRLFTDYSITDNQVLVGAKGNLGIGSVYGEVGFSNREQAFDNAVFVEDADTQTAAFRVGGTLRPSRLLDVKASYDYGDIDDPFTRISPSKVNKFRVRVNSRPSNGLTVGGHYTYRKVENTISEFDFTQNGFGVHGTYTTPTGSFFTVAYNRFDIDQQIPVSFWLSFAAPTLSTAMQDLANNVFTVAADVTVSQSFPLAVYGSASVVGSDSEELGFTTEATPGAVIALNFYDLIAGVRYTFARGWFFDAQGRFIDYQDDNVFVNGLDDYDAGIFTLALGIRFD